MVEKSGVEKFLFALGLKSSWLKSPGLKGLWLKLGIEKSGVEMSFNPLDILVYRKIQQKLFANALDFETYEPIAMICLYTKIRVDPGTVQCM